MNNIHKAKEVADWFIAWSEYKGKRLTRLSLQKLLYFSQGYSLAILGRAIFSDEIEAWVHGPVVRGIWQDNKADTVSLGNYTIDYIDNFDFNLFSKEETQLLADVWETFGDKNAKHLENITHLEYPWKNSYVENSNELCVIDLDDLNNYYSDLLYEDFLESEEGVEFIEFFEKSAA